MALKLEQAKKHIQKPNKSNIISKAIKHERDIRFHAESFTDSADLGQSLTNYLDWVKSLLPLDKYEIFLSLFQYPTPVVELANMIFNELERVFDGKNPVLNYQFEDSTYRDDWEYYRQNILNEPDVWRKKGWNAVKTAINSVLIVDLPKNQEGPYPAPYFYFLGIENVVDFEAKDDKIEWIIFKQPGDRYAVFDDEHRRTFKLDSKKETILDLIETPHDLGYCPAKFFWSTSLNQKYPDIKKSPLSAQIANLNWLLFFAVSKKHLDLYAPYPIYSAYAADCDFKDMKTLDYCDGGHLKNKAKHYIMNGIGKLTPCPVCSGKRLTGVGSLVEIPIPGPNQPDIKDPVKITSVDAESLKYNVEEVNRLKSEVFKYVVGTGGSIEQKESINEMQVQANFESRISVLNSLKGNLEAIIKFADDTCCIDRYGDNFLGSSISLGTEFYIYSAEELYAQYEQAKKNGGSSALLDQITTQIIETEYRNNPQEMQRMLILKHLEPYRHYTLEELLKLQDKQLLNNILLIIKINFSTFVDRFEREQGNIIEFASQLSFDKKIQIITEKFKEYGREQIEPGTNTDPESQGGTGENQS